MPIENPAALVEEFKKSGEFDRLRRELLTQFQHDVAFPDFKKRVEGVARQRLLGEEMLQYLPPDVVQKELAQEIDRFPIVESWVRDAKMFSDPAFATNIHSAIQKIVNEDSKLKTPSAYDVKDSSTNPGAYTTLEQTDSSKAQPSADTSATKVNQPPKRTTESPSPSGIVAISRQEEPSGEGSERMEGIIEPQSSG